MAGAVGISGEVAPRRHERRNGGACCPHASCWVKDVHFIRGIRRDSASTHNQHFAIKVQRSRLPCGPRYRYYRADSVSDRIEAKRVGGVDHRATGEIRCARQINDAIYGARWCVHNPYRRVHHLRPLGAYSSSRIKLPDLVGGSYVDVEPAQDIKLIVNHRKTTWQDCA